MTAHLEELRWRLLRILAALAVAGVVGWYVQPWVYAHLTELIRPMIPRDVKYSEAFRSVTDAFMLKLRLAFAIGLILAVPYCVVQIWGFVEPGLKPKERKPFRIIMPLSVLLFAVGAFLCWLILPSAFGWFVSYVTEFPDVGVIQEPGNLIFFILKMILAFGLGFQLPIIVFFLAKIGVLGPETLKQYWRQATVGVFLGAAILTPSNDMFSMLMLAVPLALLFFLSVLAVSVTSRKDKTVEFNESP